MTRISCANDKSPQTICREVKDTQEAVALIAERIAKVQVAIASAAKRAGRDAQDISLLAVSKRQSEQRLKAAHESGLRDFGENYLQGLQEHESMLPADTRWHFIGHIQSKKAKHLASLSLVHSVDSLRVARKVAASASEAGHTQAILLNVNISQQISKSGVAPKDLGVLLGSIVTLPGIEVRGLMCIPSPEEEPRRAFARLRELRDKVKGITGTSLPELSMGMSADFEDAILEGSTIVRVGTGIFGPRENPVA